MNERIRQIAELLPDGCSITLSKAALSELAADNAATDAVNRPIMPDLSIADIIAATGKARSTVHGWINSGELKAYMFGNEKRVTPQAWQDFLAKRREGKNTQREPVPHKGDTADLGAWRKQLKKAG